jgi:hypothetical protein
MSWNQIARRWRADLINKLQDRDGLPKKEARKKAEKWMDWLKELSGLQRGTKAASGPRTRSRVPPGKSRSSIQKSRSAASL